jgi:hypothetical protein
MRFVKSTITDVKRLLGKKHSEKDVEIESHRAAYKIVDQDGKLAVQVSKGKFMRGRMHIKRKERKGKERYTTEQRGRIAVEVWRRGEMLEE